ncbi:MAG: alpha-L-arabinofuranosidase C-terminal domain-containing protein [Candidatus Dadabacteria bacterium]
MRKQLLLRITIALLISSPLSVFSQKTYVVKPDVVKATVQPTMWGIFFEDINLAADGGVYAELVKNRSFEFAAPLMGWREIRKEGGNGSVLVINRSGSHDSNPRFVRASVSKGTFGISNEGFRGMGIKSGNQYDFSVLARQTKGSNVSLNIELVNSKGEKIGGATLVPKGEEWKKYHVSFSSSATDPKSRLNIWLQGKGSVDMDMISLFPMDTWKNRPGGLRADLVQLLADLKPGFLRFPGGCIVEGRELATRYQWKKTVGDIDNRKQIINRWNTEFRHRPTPDYYQTFGLGFYEYFQMAEDIGAEPLPILNCGMACQFNTAEVVPTNEIDPYIQDALDLIEFANGSTQTKWGNLRSKMGHPKPFNLKMLGVGNEQWGPQYIERYLIFTKAIKAKYPNIRMVNSVGPDPDDERFNFLNDTLRKLKADILDEHYYRSPEWFTQNAHRYDNYDRNGPKIFAGEYAAQSVQTVSPDNKNNWKCALSEAAFMTGLERNADVVNMASYAPLFAHTEGWQWTPNLIWFDNLNSYGTPDYYVQKLFSNYKGTNVVPVLENNSVIAGQDSCYASAVINRPTNELIIKVVNTDDKEQVREIQIDGSRTINPAAILTVLKSDRLDDVNSLTDPIKVKPVEQKLNVNGRSVSLSLAPYSVSVLKIKLQ